jgi:Protein of unknown function (DUF2612)
MPTGTPGTLNYYLSLITSEYANQPNFLATVNLLLTPYVQTINLLQNLFQLFQLSTAVGDQLTKLGAWAGVSRNVTLPITGAYFSLDTAGLGLDQAPMQGPNDPSSGLVALPDNIYLPILQAFILINNSKGTLNSYYNALNQLFPGCKLVIQDFGNGTLFYGLTATPQNPVIAQLFTQGYFSVAPAGVGVISSEISSPSSTNVPFFGLDVENSTISGLDVGIQPLG